MKHQGLKKGIYIVPNLITTANLFCGFFAVTKAIAGDYLFAAWLICIASFFDFIDGRVARFTKAQSRFGLEYDSLCDLISFGLAPAILMYQWSLFHFGRLGWAAAFLFFACGALRLARFNVQSNNVEKNRFQGLPIPAAASCLISYVILYHHEYGSGPAESYLILILTFLVAVLMVSNIPYHSFKELDRSKRANFFLLVLLVGFIFVIASAPQIMFFVLSIGYMLSGILEEIIRSPKRIRTFADFLSRFFHARPDELMMDKEGQKKNQLKVVSMKDKNE